eukprot:scaffold277444_cov28-Tisochrysis_lutea.AAC.3
MRERYSTRPSPSVMTASGARLPWEMPKRWSVARALNTGAIRTLKSPRTSRAVPTPAALVAESHPRSEGARGAVEIANVIGGMSASKNMEQGGSRGECNAASLAWVDSKVTDRPIWSSVRASSPSTSDGSAAPAACPTGCTASVRQPTPLATSSPSSKWERRTPSSNTLFRPAQLVPADGSVVMESWPALRAPDRATSGKSCMSTGSNRATRAAAASAPRESSASSASIRLAPTRAASAVSLRRTALDSSNLSSSIRSSSCRASGDWFKGGRWQRAQGGQVARERRLAAAPVGPLECSLPSRPPRQRPQCSSVSSSPPGESKTHLHAPIAEGLEDTDGVRGLCEHRGAVLQLAFLRSVGGLGESGQ